LPLLLLLFALPPLDEGAFSPLAVTRQTSTPLGLRMCNARHVCAGREQRAGAHVFAIIDSRKMSFS